MPQNILSQKNSIILITVILIALGGGYYMYSFSENASSDGTSSGVVDPSLFKPDLAAYYKAKDNIKLKEKDFAFTKKSFYENLKDNTVDFPSVKPTGRLNPFWAP